MAGRLHLDPYSLFLKSSLRRHSHVHLSRSPNKRQHEGFCCPFGCDHILGLCSSRRLRDQAETFER